MNEDFVPYELAVKLKEKGFNWNCVSFYALENFIAEYVDDCGDCYEVDFEIEGLYLNYPLRYKKYETKCLPAPTISQVLKWLREEKKIYIMINFWPAGYVAEIYTRISKDKNRFDWERYIDECDYDDSYELAAIAGIEYVIDNLI